MGWNLARLMLEVAKVDKGVCARVPELIKMVVFVMEGCGNGSGTRMVPGFGWQPRGKSVM